MEWKKIPSKTRLLVALILGGVALITGFVISLNNPYGNTIDETQQVENAINEEFATAEEMIKKGEKKGDRFADLVYGVEFEKIEEITGPLVYTNQRIAKAKALLRFDENPIPSYSFDYSLWTNRFDISKQDWKIQSFSSRILTGTGIGFGVFFATTIIAYLILTIVPWLWYCLLNRISELSQAIRGR